MGRRVYIETSVISYLVARPSRNILAAAWQQVTQEWWDKQRARREAMDDAVHIAVAAVHGVDYLLTWNCRHLDNAERKPLVRSVCAVAGYRCPEICTPQELMGEQEND